MTWNETRHHREGPALPHMGGGSCWDTPAPKTLCPSGGVPQVLDFTLWASLGEGILITLLNIS